MNCLRHFRVKFCLTEQWMKWDIFDLAQKYEDFEVTPWLPFVSCCKHHILIFHHAVLLTYNVSYYFDDVVGINQWLLMWTANI